MNRTMTLLTASLALSAFFCAIQQSASAQKAALPTGTPLVSGDVHAFKSYGTGLDTSTVEVTSATGQTFQDSLRLTVLKEPLQYWHYGTTMALSAPLHKGDVLWLSMWARRLTSRKESGEAQVEAALMQTVNGKEVRPLERRLSFGPTWTQFRLPFVVGNDSEIGQARLGFRYGYGIQSLEVGGIQLLNYGPGVKLDDLPRTLIRYEGWAADAPWRKAAAERIAKYRKGDLTVRVMDAAGKSVPNAQVQVRMKRHAFAWGAQIDARDVTDTDDNSAHVRQIAETYFNKVVFGNDLKWGRWFTPNPNDRYGKPQALAALPWLAEHEIPLRAHVMVWPSWQHSPQFLRDLKSDPDALRKSILDHIDAQTHDMNGRAAEWDVVNETYAHHDMLDLLGRKTMLDWYRAAKSGAPHTKLFYNDYTMFQPGEASQYFYDTVKYLQDNGAPIDGIGEQGHFASSPPGIPDVIATLDKFGKLGLPIQISEFDIDTDDQGLQTDFMRDFTTAVFSEPATIGIVQWGVGGNRGPQWTSTTSLWDKNWNLRPHGQAWVDLTTKTWWTNADGQTAKDGVYKTRGFYGDYEITVLHGGKSQTKPFKLVPTNGVLTVTLT